MDVGLVLSTFVDNDSTTALSRCHVTPDVHGTHGHSVSFSSPPSAASMHCLALSPSRQRFPRIPARSIKIQDFPGIYFSFSFFFPAFCAASPNLENAFPVTLRAPFPTFLPTSMVFSPPASRVSNVFVVALSFAPQPGQNSPHVCNSIPHFSHFIPTPSEGAPVRLKKFSEGAKNRRVS